MRPIVGEFQENKIAFWAADLLQAEQLVRIVHLSQSQISMTPPHLFSLLLSPMIMFDEMIDLFFLRLRLLIGLIVM